MRWVFTTECLRNNFRIHLCSLFYLNLANLGLCVKPHLITCLLVPHLLFNGTAAFPGANCRLRKSIASKPYLAARMAFLLSADAGKLKRSALFCSLCSTKGTILKPEIAQPLTETAHKEAPVLLLVKTTQSHRVQTFLLDVCVTSYLSVFLRAEIYHFHV